MSANNTVVDDVPVSQSSLSGDDEPTFFSRQTMLDSDSQLEMEELIEKAELANCYFFKRPAPWWSWILIFITGIAVAATAVYRRDLFTEIVCEELRPQLSSKSLVWFFELETSIRYSKWWTIPVMRSRLCYGDEEVRKTVDGLILAIDITLGVFSCLTVGYWMQLSDRYGRVKILPVAVFGLLNHVIMFVTSVIPDKLPGGFRFFLFGQMIEGILGGRIVLSSILLAYITDTSQPDLRTLNLVIATGLDMMGNSLGPSFSTYLHTQSYNLLTVYYYVIAFYVFLILVTVFLVPESISKFKLIRGRKIYTSMRKPNLDETYSKSPNLSIAGRLRAQFGNNIRLLIFPFQALAVFLPHLPRDEKTGAALDEPWDWNLSLVGCALFLRSVAGSDGRYLIRYLEQVLVWHSQGGHSFWFRYIHVIRAALLVIVFLAFIHCLRKKTVIKSQHPDSSQVDSELSPDLLDSLLKLDYIIALASMIVLVVSMFFITVVQDSTGWYSIIMFRSLSMGYEAALRSLALSLYTRQIGHDTESGKLLGALGVLGWIGGNVIGPAIFEPLYNRTATYFPQAMMLFTGVLGIVTIVVILPIRITSRKIEI